LILQVVSVYVADTGNKSIQKFDSKGNLITKCIFIRLPKISPICTISAFAYFAAKKNKASFNGGIVESYLCTNGYIIPTETKDGAGGIDQPDQLCEDYIG
jgi:hypothetical protein